MTAHDSHRQLSERRNPQDEIGNDSMGEMREMASQQKRREPTWDISDDVRGAAHGTGTYDGMTTLKGLAIGDVDWAEARF